MARITLTIETAERLEFLWQLTGGTLSDQAICQRVGIGFGQLRGWLRRNSKPLRPDGTTGLEGLRAIRTRAKVSTLTGYLAKLNQIAEEARGAGDYSTAANAYKWLLEKQFPAQYGKRTPPPEGEQAGKTGVAEVPPTDTDKEQWSRDAQQQTKRT
jgi:hypothetical protein